MQFFIYIFFLQQAAKGVVVKSTTGATCASVITTAWYMASVAQTMNISAPQVRLLPTKNIEHQN